MSIVKLLVYIQLVLLSIVQLGCGYLQKHANVPLTIGPTTIPYSEYYALQDLYNSTGGNNWIWGDVALHGPIWFDEAPDPCSTPYWQGLNCTCVGRSCHIVGIQLKNYDLIGSLPHSLQNLELLTVFDFQGNQLNGSIPDFIEQYESLEVINLSENRFVGPFPSFIGSMTKLQSLVLANTLITGTIPSSIGSLTNLLEFDVVYTKLNGTLPEEIYSLTSLQYLLVGANLMSGSLSESVGNLVNLIELEFALANFTGTIPSSIGRLSQLQILYMDSTNVYGTIPESFFWLQNLEVCYLYFNSLNGTLSKSIGNMTSLVDLAVYNNEFSGSIPTRIGNLENLHILQIYNNKFNGSIPEELYNATSLNNIYLYGNLLTGTISPNISKLKDLTEITFNSNQLTGPIPEDICQCEKMYNFDLFSNHLSNSIPECIFSYKAVSGIRVDSNQLTGSLPQNVTSKDLGTLALYNNFLTGPMPSFLNALLISLEVSDNYFSGPLSEGMFRRDSTYGEIIMEHNFFTGSLPSTMGELIFLKYLYLTNNLFSGSIPTELSNIRFLVLAFFNENLFSGSIACFNATNQWYLSSIELSNNYLTGSIPAEVFHMQNLQTFAVVSNCLTGTIPEDICGARLLSAVALDGMHTASSCQQKILPFFNSYTVKYNMPGSLPWCLFGLDKMETLHVSGNGFAGSVPSDLRIVPSLTDLVLSHNAFTGSIPHSLASQQFVNLDLSFNKLTGVLDDTNVTVPDDGYLYLQVNRLSGQIPKKLRDAETISILDGNIFVCSYTRESLPKHDKQYAYYECGTSSLQHALYVWLVLGCILVLVVIALVCAARFTVTTAQPLKVVQGLRWLHELVKEAMEVFTEESRTSFILPNIRLFGRFLTSLRSALCVATGYILVVLLTINVILSQHYGSYQYKYAWNVSSVYVSGSTPAIILLVFLLLWLCWMFGTFHYFLIPFSAVDEKKVLRGSDGSGRDSDNSDNEEASGSKMGANYKHYMWLSCIAIFNCGIVLLVNVVYVNITLNSKPSVVAVVQVLIAVFKLVWNDVVVRWMTQLAHHYSTRTCSGEAMRLSANQQRKIEGKYLSFHTYMMLFNIIITPCLATAAVSSDCFYTVIIPAAPIALSYSYLTCGNILNLKNETCNLNHEVVAQTSYHPPYSYGYQCSSTLVTTYAVLYVYMFVLTAFLQPLLVILWTWHKHKYVRKPQNNDKSLELKQVGRLFYKDRFNLRLLTFLSVYVTFGVIFPPLAVIICFAMCVQTYFTQLELGHRINTDGASDDPQMQRLALLEVLERDCVNTADLFKHSLYDVGPVAALFYSFIIFDTYGDAEGGKKAIGVTVTMIVVGTLLSCAAYCVLNVDIHKVKWRWLNRQSERSTVNGSGLSPSECEMQRTSSVLHAVAMGKDPILD